MNRRIQELAKQSGVYFGDASMDYFGECQPAFISTDRMDLEKFAELIVRECAKSAIDLESIPDWYQDSVTMIPHHCSKNILKHFGVEE